MKIALLGGAFDPPHICHLLAAVWVKSTTDVDRIWFVPTYLHAFGKDLADFELRCRMLSLALEPLKDFTEISRVEQELGGESRTIDTMRALLQQRPDDVFSLVIGSDILLEAHKWKRFDLLEELVEFHVLGRTGYPVDDPRIGLELPAVSSTEIRAHLRRGDVDWCRPLVPRKVLEFILEHRLYQQPVQEPPEPEEPCRS